MLPPEEDRLVEEANAHVGSDLEGLGAGNGRCDAATQTDVLPQTHQQARREEHLIGKVDQFVVVAVQGAKGLHADGRGNGTDRAGSTFISIEKIARCQVGVQRGHHLVVIGNKHAQIPLDKQVVPVDLSGHPGLEIGGVNPNLPVERVINRKLGHGVEPLSGHDDGVLRCGGRNRKPSGQHIVGFFIPEQLQFQPGVDVAPTVNRQVEGVFRGIQKRSANIDGSHIANGFFHDNVIPVQVESIERLRIGHEHSLVLNKLGPRSIRHLEPVVEGVGKGHPVQGIGRLHVGRGEQSGRYRSEDCRGKNVLCSHGNRRAQSRSRRGDGIRGIGSAPLGPGGVIVALSGARLRAGGCRRGRWGCHLR